MRAAAVLLMWADCMDREEENWKMLSRPSSTCCLLAKKDSPASRDGVSTQRLTKEQEKCSRAEGSKSSARVCRDCSS